MPIQTPGRGWLRAHPTAADVLLAVGILATFVCAVMLLGSALGLRTLTEGFAVLVVVYTAAALLPLRRAIAATAVIAVATAVVLAFSNEEQGGAGLWFSNALTLLVCFFI